MRKDTRPVAPLETARPLGDYRLVILGTPVWAGRSSAVMRSFLKDRGGEIRNAAYVLTRSSGSQYQEVYRQMDLCVPAGHLAAVSLRSGDVGWAFWQEEFLRQVRAFPGGAVAADPFLKSTGEEMPHAGKTEGAGPCGMRTCRPSWQTRLSMATRSG